MLIVVKFISLFLAIWFSIVNFGAIVVKEEMPVSNYIIQALSITVFVFIQFKLYI